jgi:hypothetical protein
MSTVVNFRPFRVPQVTETQFFTSSNQANKEFAEADLSRSGLTVDDMYAYHHPMLRLKEGAQAGYIIPYFNLQGEPIVDKSNNLVMYRTRMKFPEFSKEQRYTQPSSEQLLKYDLPSFVPYIHPLTLTLKGETLVCCEGEKKTVSVLKHLGIPAFGIGGCQMWRNPNGNGGIHPWIRELFRSQSATSITIVPDGDIFRYDICNAYGTFARALEAEGIAVQILNPKGKIDDLLVEWAGEARQRFAQIERLELGSLVQSPASLVTRYGLAFKSDAKGHVLVHQHTANIMKLMEEHNAFPKIWRNLDNNRVMVGEEIAKPDLTEMQIANYFQYNLGFDKVSHRTVYSCIQALSKQNARSPMLDHIRSQVWDGVPRLDSWLSRLWGVEDSPYTREIAAKWIVSSCARMDKPGTKIDWMLIVIGPQGTGKTTMPSVLFNGLNLTLYGEHNDKDLHMLLHSALCVGFDELDSFGKRESSNLKAMITRNEDAFRPPYGASVEIFPRRFTLYGCGNRYEFLQHDPSGYRRYAVVEVDKLLNFSGLESERDQLWAEAWARYTQGGVKFWEIDGASERAERYVISNPVEDRILGFLSAKMKDKITPAKTGHIYFTMSEILQFLDINASGNSSMTREIAAILRGLGAEKPEKTTRHPETGVAGKFYRLPIDKLM